MKRKQPFFLIAPPNQYGGSGLFIAYHQGDPVDSSEEEAEREENSVTNWIRTVCSGVKSAARRVRIPRMQNRATRQAAGT